MKIIKAHWEKRNLDVDAIEVIVEEGDSARILEDVVKQENANYIVVKVPSTLHEFLFELPRFGFHFIETISNCHHCGGSFGFNALQERIMQKTKSWLVDSTDTEKLINEIGLGIFGTDRISVDPRFGPKMANRRYSNWILDEIQKGALVHNVEVDGKRIGFFALKKLDESRYFLFLSGLYLTYQESGLGFCPHFRGIQEGINLGAKRVLLSYSSNNRGAAGLHMGMGHKLDEILHVFISHR